jgi:lysophospholipase L1-like esterase
MKWIFAFGLVAVFGSALQAQTINLRGRVSDGAGQPVANAVVELLQKGLKDTTGSDGAYAMVRPSVSLLPYSAAPAKDMRLKNGILELRVGEPSPVKVVVFDVNGSIRKMESLPNVKSGVYRFTVARSLHSNGILIVQASIASARSVSGTLAKVAAVVDTLKVSAAGYSSRKIALSTYDTTVSVTLDPDATSVYHPCPTNGTPCKILPFGDSITEGVASSDGAGYRSQLFKSILAANQKVTFVGSLSNGPTTVSGSTFPRSHEGHAGWTIAPGTSEFGSGGIASLLPSPALNGAPHIILLHIGANDVFPAGRETMATRLEALVEKIAQNAPNALIVLAQHTPIGTSNRGHTQAQVDAANAAQQSYNSKIPAIIQSQIAKGRHIIGVDMSKMPLSGLTTSSMHPNDQGYAYMAGIWYAAIKDLLAK